MRRLVCWTLVALVLAARPAHGPTAQPAVPTPESVIGFVPCSDYQLATSEQIAAYFRALDAATPRLRLEEIGRTTEGRPQLMALVSSAPNLRNADRYKEIARRLAQGRDLTDEQARALARDGKAVVWINFGLHSTEVGHAQAAPLLAHKVVTAESAEMRFIRDNVIFLLVPDMNPDGTTLVADWYMAHVGTRFEQSTPPELYHTYAGHENNRDWFMFNTSESRNVATQLYVEWFPQIVYDQHQAAPFPARIFVPPFDDPMNPNIPPLVIRGINLVGGAITRRLDQQNKPGAISRVGFDTWWNGGMRTAPYFHNMVGILTETAHASATPATYDPKSFPPTFDDGTPTLQPSTDYPSPYTGGEWHLRDTCDYMVTASMAVLDLGARRRQEWLYDIYRMARDAVAAGAGEAYIVSAEQWDPGTAVKMINVLRWGGVEVERARAPFEAGGKLYPAGSFVIRGAQPFRPYLTDLLNPQIYPDRTAGGLPEHPYDITGWTLPYQMGVRVDKVTNFDPGADALPLEQVEWAAPPVGALPDEPAPFAYALDPRANDAFTAVNRLLKAGETIYRATSAIALGEERWPAGAFLIQPRAGTHDRLLQVATSLGLTVTAAQRAAIGETVRLKPPRLGVYHSWGGNSDEGWTRWLLEQFEFPYTRVYDDDLRAGNLLERYDIILLPDETYRRMLTGRSPRVMPAPYAGGMTPLGVTGLYAFVTNGGNLIALDSASELPLTTFALPVSDVTQNRRGTELYIPGSILSLTVDPTHPVAFGMPSETAAFFDESPVFAVGPPPNGPASQAGDTAGEVEDVRVVASYPARDLLLSGWLLGERVVANRAAVVEVRVEQGRVVLIGFRAQHRGQSHATFKLLFNAIYWGTAESVPLSPITTEQGSR